MSFDEIYNQVKDLKGWMGRNSCEKLYEYASKIQNGLIVEIGSFMGISTKVMALSSPTSKIIAIDPYLTVHPSSGLTDPLYVKDRFLKVMKGHNFKLRQAKSETVGRTWNDLIDFLHIDGDHHIENLKKDIELFVPHVKKGHYVFFDDYAVGGFDDDGTETYESLEKKRQADEAVNNHFEYLEDIGAMVKFVVNREKDKWFDQVISDTQVYSFAICRKS